MNNSYNLQFEKLCSKLKLGELIEDPEPLPGGLLHRMFAIETTLGKYAVKALNPQIMARPAALNNYILSERIANILSKHIPAQPANLYKDTFLHDLNDQFYIIFDWIEGSVLRPFEITEAHCKRIGFILAEIHQTNFPQIDSRPEVLSEEKQIHWDFYLNKGKKQASIWVSGLSNIIGQLTLWTNQANWASKKLATEKVFSHRDLEPKNVIWKQEGPIVIDWESAGAINPKHDLIETAIYWSVNEQGQIDKDKFCAFLDGYIERYGKVEADWRVVIELGYSNKLDWLEYSLKRSLKIECTDVTEQEMGTKQVVDTIDALKEYEKLASMLEDWLNDKNE